MRGHRRIGQPHAGAVPARARYSAGRFSMPRLLVRNPFRSSPSLGGASSPVLMQTIAECKTDSARVRRTWRPCYPIVGPRGRREKTPAASRVILGNGLSFRMTPARGSPASLATWRATQSTRPWLDPGDGRAARSPDARASHSPMLWPGIPDPDRQECVGRGRIVYEFPVGARLAPRLFESLLVGALEHPLLHRAGIEPTPPKRTPTPSSRWRGTRQSISPIPPPLAMIAPRR